MCPGFENFDERLCEMRSELSQINNIANERHENVYKMYNIFHVNCCNYVLRTRAKKKCIIYMFHKIWKGDFVHIWNLLSNCDLPPERFIYVSAFSRTFIRRNKIRHDVVLALHAAAPPRRGKSRQMYHTREMLFSSCRIDNITRGDVRGEGNKKREIFSRLYIAPIWISTLIFFRLDVRSESSEIKRRQASNR